MKVNEYPWNPLLVAKQYLRKYTAAQKLISI